MVRLALFQKWIRLDAEDRLILARAWLGLVRVDVELHGLGFRRLLRAVEQIEPRGRPARGAPDAARARRYAYWLEVASRHHVIRARCLHRSLVLHRWLRGERVASRFRIGVRKQGDLLIAHAWVEVGGAIVTDRADFIAPFQPLENQGTRFLSDRRLAFVD